MNFEDKVLALFDNGRRSAVYVAGYQSARAQAAAIAAEADRLIAEMAVENAELREELKSRQAELERSGSAPAVQGEPVAWNDLPVAPDGFVLMPRDLTNEMVRAFCMATVHRWDDVPEDQKIEVAEKLQHAFDAVIAVAPLPAEQQPAPDVSALVEALQTACDYLPIGSRALELAREALAAHRKGDRP